MNFSFEIFGLVKSFEVMMGADARRIHPDSS